MQLCANCGSDNLRWFDPIPLLDPLTDPIRYRYEYLCEDCDHTGPEEELAALDQAEEEE